MRTEIALTAPAKVTVSESLKDDENVTFFRPDDELLERTVQAELQVGYTDDPDEREPVGFYVDAEPGYVVNTETGRTFRARVSFQLTRDDAKALHAYLGALLEMVER